MLKAWHGLEILDGSSSLQVAYDRVHRVPAPGSRGLEEKAANAVGSENGVE